MGAILMRAACFILIIILGHVLRRIGFFKKDDFYVLSKTVLKITLPAAIISNMNGMKIEPSLLGLCLLGFGGGVLYMTVLYLLNLRSSREKRAFEVLNSTGLSGRFLQHRFHDKGRGKRLFCKKDRVDAALFYSV